MLAHRVGALGAIVAVVVLSLELVGALAWKHHARADDGITSALVLPGEPSGFEQFSMVGHVTDQAGRDLDDMDAAIRAGRFSKLTGVPTSSSVVLDSTLEQVTVSARGPF